MNKYSRRNQQTMGTEHRRIASLAARQAEAQDDINSLLEGLEELSDTLCACLYRLQTDVLLGTSATVAVHPCVSASVA